jgi:hypothetical protein
MDFGAKNANQPSKSKNLYCLRQKYAHFGFDKYNDNMDGKRIKRASAVDFNSRNMGRNPK